jgi:hypothetical protein
MDLKSLRPQSGGKVILIDTLIEQTAKLVLSGIGTAHHRLIDHVKVGVTDRLKLKSAVDGHGG